MSEIKISDEARECARKENSERIAYESGCHSDECKERGYHIQLLLNQRDERVRLLLIQQASDETARSEMKQEIVLLTAELAELRKDYNELIMCVARKFPNETRHQTAKRYIEEAEWNALGAAAENKDAVVKGGER